jgi:ATP-binding cassette, subfamily C (CFTR/MRP), member 1
VFKFLHQVRSPLESVWRVPTCNALSSFLCLRAGLSLFRGALHGVLRSSIPDFFDTTPTGRIMSRLSKDQDTLDTQLPTTLFQLLFTLFQVFGTIALVFYTFPLLGIIFAPLFLAYFIVATFYRRTSVETKRLDSLLRSALYASYTGPSASLPLVCIIPVRV